MIYLSEFEDVMGNDGVRRAPGKKRLSATSKRWGFATPTASDFDREGMSK